MFTEFYDKLVTDWVSLDTWIVVTGALAAMSCALPGAWLLLRRQSLLGDALSHSILPGIVLAYLGLHGLENIGWVSRDSGLQPLVLFVGAAASGVLSAVLTEFVERWGRVDRGAVIGVVFTSMFALGLLLIRMFADKTHVDPGCVLYGSLEESAIAIGTSRLAIPQAALMSGAILAINGILVILFFKELRLSTFDPALSAAVGLNSNWIQLALMAMTAATFVAAFKSVGAILVIAMLIVPPATARLLTDRLSVMLLLSLAIAALSALLGHIGALTFPSIVFSRLGYADVKDASTTGMMAVASGFLFVVAIVGSPRHGIIRRVIDRVRVQIRIAGEDLLGILYRHDERPDLKPPSIDADFVPLRTWIEWRAQKWLHHKGYITAPSATARLTNRGREKAQNLVRSHRLWETYMARHFQLPGDHLHATAEQVEHFLSPELQTELAKELDQPGFDPHGAVIPHSADVKSLNCDPAAPGTADPITNADQ